MMFEKLKEDITTILRKDPSARNAADILFSYPGLHAIWIYRFAHFLWKRRFQGIARFISHIGRWLTGIEIHPGAQIGRRLFIDHGMGVVIGETAEIGDDVLLYQGAVLGGTTLKKKKRHPTLENEVEVGAGATMLGAIHIGEGARIGAGSVVISDVSQGATVVGVPGRIAMGFSAREIETLEHANLPDPVADAVRFVARKQERLEERIKYLESLEGIVADSNEEEIEDESVTVSADMLKGSGI
jgi:serine O-acetyltransferase